MRKRSQAIPWKIVRYVTGRPLDGYPRSDATFLRAGTAPARGETPGRWSMLPGWQRSAWRLGVPTAAVTGLVAYTGAPEITTAATGTGAVCATGIIGWRTIQHRVHDRTYVKPFRRTLERDLGPVRVVVPLNYRDEGADPVRVTLPAHTRIPPELKTAVREIVAQKLGLHDPAEQWVLIGPEPYATFRPAPRPPGRVGFRDVAEAVRTAPEHAPVLGIGPRGIIVCADLEADSPHIAISAGSGGGKSILVRAILAHGLHHGAGVVILDYKRSSHKWAEGLPGVVICKNIEDIHNWSVRVGEETERRNRSADDEAGYNPTRVYLVVEEWNALAGKLQAYWDLIRTKDDPKRSPAVQAIADVTFMGRHVRANVIGVAQMLTARTTGGPETRENFATRALTRYSVNAWRMLAPEVWPAPKRSRHVGRWQIVKSGEAYETQVAYLADDEAREWALSGVANPADVLSQGPSNPVTLVKQAATVPPTKHLAQTRLVSLREAVEENLLPGRPVTLAALRKWSQRHHGFPTVAETIGAEHTYALPELIAYKRRRDAIQEVEGDVA